MADAATATIGHLKEFFHFELPPTTNFIYVATNGSDSATGKIDDPLRTIGKAFSVVNYGDSILVRGGEYREKLEPDLPDGTAESYISLMGFNAEMPTMVAPRQTCQLTVTSGCKVSMAMPILPFATLRSRNWTKP